MLRGCPCEESVDIRTPVVYHGVVNRKDTMADDTLEQAMLRELAKPFPNSMIQAPPKGKYGSFVSHSEVTQRLLHITGGRYTFTVDEIVRGWVPPRPATPNREARDALDDAIVGVLATLTIPTLGFSCTEAGDVDDPQNWDTDGARLKDAVSDVLKRCCSRAGLGLHLWAQDRYFLHKLLTRDNEGGDDE